MYNAYMYIIIHVNIYLFSLVQVLNVRGNNLKDSGVPSSIFQLQELVTLVS